MIQVHVQYATEAENIPDAGTICDWAGKALADLQPDAELTVRIVDREESRQLNERWRNTPRATNVLSFPADAPEMPAEAFQTFIGDIVICAPVVFEEAVAQGKQPRDHWAHMVIHGILHLAGYDHIEDAMAETMESLEIRILADIGINNPYIIS